MKSLTKYTPASFAELWSISYPLMLTTLSGNLMLFFDRMLLSRYSAIAMAAATTIGMLFTIFQFASISIAAIAEVFVGKYNGAGENSKIGPLVWQMIWFSVFTTIIFLPVGLYCGKLFLPQEYFKYGLAYFKVIMIFGPMFPLVAALSSFFIGQGKVQLVALSTIAINILNIILAYLFIFGLPPYIPEGGAVGAALASGCAISLQATILFAIFLNRKYRILNNTGAFYLKVNEFINCLKVGAPNAMGYLIEMSAWACLLQIMVRKDNAHILVLAIDQAIFLLLAFTTDGLQKAITAIASNILGMKKWNLLPNLIKSALKLHGILILVFAIPLLLFPQELIQLFFSTQTELENSTLVMNYAILTCAWILIYFVFDGIVWIAAGMLIAFEDTLFIMFMNAASVWLLAILPIYIAVNYFNSNPAVTWQLMTVYALFNAVGFCLRYYFNNRVINRDASLSEFIWDKKHKGISQNISK